MKRLIALATLVGAVLVLPTMATGKTDAQGPPCADIIGGSALYQSGTLNLAAELAKSPCSKVTYTLYVYDDNTSATPLVTQSQYVWLNDTTIGLSATADDDGVVCVAMTTSIGKHVIDRAPDSGCINVSDTPPGFGGFS